MTRRAITRRSVARFKLGGAELEFGRWLHMPLYCPGEEATDQCMRLAINGLEQSKDPQLRSKVALPYNQCVIDTDTGWPTCDYCGDVPPSSDVPKARIRASRN